MKKSRTDDDWLLMAKMVAYYGGFMAGPDFVVELEAHGIGVWHVTGKDGKVYEVTLGEQGAKIVPQAQG